MLWIACRLRDAVKICAESGARKPLQRLLSASSFMGWGIDFDCTGRTYLADLTWFFLDIEWSFSSMAASGTSIVAAGKAGLQVQIGAIGTPSSPITFVAIPGIELGYGEPSGWSWSSGNVRSLVR